MGSDVRLLGIVDRLRQAGHEVSLFFRAHTDNALRVPPSASLSRRQVLDLGVEVDAAGGGAKASAALRGDAVRWAHFTVDLGGAQPSAETPGLAATRLMLAGKNASAANRTALALPPITTAWQDRALWRQAFRHVGIANSALPAVWKALARELPSLFRRGGSGNQSS